MLHRRQFNISQVYVNLYTIWFKSIQGLSWLFLLNYWISSGVEVARYGQPGVSLRQW